MGRTAQLPELQKVEKSKIPSEFNATIVNGNAARHYAFLASFVTL
jgi:hypothetical protein